MRRIAWKQCRSCSADSLSMWPDSFARWALAGMDALAARLEHRGDRVLREPVDLEIGMELAQLVGDRRRRAGRGRARSARRCRARACARDLPAHPARAAARGGATKSRSSRLTLTGSRTWGPWPEPSSRTSSPPVPRRARCPGAAPVIASSSPWMTSTGQLHARARARACSSGVEPGPPAWRSESRRRLEAPADAVLDRLGRVRLGEHLREEELEEAAVVRAASSGGCTSPSPRRCRARRSSEYDAVARGRLAAAGRPGDEDGRLDALGMIGRQQQRPLRALRERQRAPRAPCRSRP